LIQFGIPHDAKKGDPIPDSSILIRLYYMTNATLQILPSSLLFESEKMKDLWRKGKNYHTSADVLNYVISKELAQRLVHAVNHEH
jgi:hypothetical protein